MTINNILLIGGGGYVGRHLTNLLSRRQVRITVPTRRRERAKHLLPFPLVDVVEADIHDDATLARLVAGKEVVINLVGVIKGGNGSTDGKPWGPGFDRAHVALAGRVAAAATQAGVKRLLHMSALRAATGAPSAYLRSKAAGEEAVRAAFPAATLFRPSAIFGQGDHFLNLFVAMARLAPPLSFLPLACPTARFQPLWVEDVAAVMVAALDHGESAGQTFDLCGPKVYTLKELADFAIRTSGQRCAVLPLGKTASFILAWLVECFGGPLTRDACRSMQQPSICGNDGTNGGLPFGLEAAVLEVIGPTYLADGRRRAGFDTLRQGAGR